MTNEEMLSVAEIVERLVARFHKQADDHEAKMVEHRAAFGARTKADAETIDRLHTERDALRAEVAELKTQLERLTSWAAKNQAARETLQTEIERLKSQTPKHPAKVGEWVRKTTDGLMYKTGEARRLVSYEIIKGEVWCHLEDGASWKMSVCEPCDPPTEATHDTPAGKQAAESAIKREPKPGDVVRLIRQCEGWDPIWGRIGDLGTVLRITTYPQGPKGVTIREKGGLDWPLSCVEIVEDAK